MKRNTDNSLTSILSSQFFSSDMHIQANAILWAYQLDDIWNNGQDGSICSQVEHVVLVCCYLEDFLLVGISNLNPDDVRALLM